MLGQVVRAAVAEQQGEDVGTVVARAELDVDAVAERYGTRRLAYR